jgi:two-component system, NtrC family, sensor kinase
MAETGSGAEIGNVADAVNAARLATLGMLVAGIAHEINTPLGALASNHDTVKRSLQRLHDILADDVVDEAELVEVRRVVRALSGAMRVNDLAMARVQALVAGLRNFGRPDRAEVDRVDLHEGIESVLTLLRHRTEAGITICRDFADVPKVECYPQRLNQVFMNLLLNAVQALEADGEGHGRGSITIRTRREQQQILIEIADDGPGIAPEERQLIFEPGFTTKERRVGMGLGLLITRQIVDLHGGSLEVRSEVGAGAAFTIRLPVSLERRAGSV